MTIKNLQTQLVQGKSQIRGLSVNSAGNTRQVVSIMDVISEGPIKGLVKGQYSVFFNDEKFADEVDSIEGGALQISYTSGSTTVSGQPDLSAEQGTFYVFTVRNAETYTMSVESFNFDKDPQPFYNTPKGILLKGPNVFTENSRFFSRVTTGVRELARINLNNGQVIKGYLQYRGPEEYNTYSEVLFTPINVTSTNQREIEAQLTGPVSYQNVELEIDYEIIFRSSTGVLGTNFPFDSGYYRTDISERAYKTYGGIKTGERGPSAFLSLRNIDSSSLEFRPGTADQEPIEGPGGIGNISVTAGINEQLTKWEENLSPDEFTLEDENSTVLINTTEMDLSAEQVSEVDEVRIAFNYDSLTSVSTEDGKEHESGAVYSIKLITYTGGTRATGTPTTVSDITRIHTGNSTVPLSFEELIFLEQYRPFQDFEIKIERLKRHSGTRVLPNGDVGDDRDELNANCTISTVTSVIKERFSYPYTAHANVTFSSVDYSDTPSRTYEIYGKLVQVPSNYTTREENDGVNASYTGFWDGTFKPKLEYTDNPAWVFYDILTNNNYGLGTWISADDIDKYSLYRIAKYCDELVDDGAGGLEPRFRSNIYLAKQADAYKVLKDMASIFLGMLYWMDGQIVAVNDEPKDALFTFSKANVLDGVFSYENTGSKARANQIIVSWNNPEESYSAEPLIVEDKENIISTGRIIKEEVAAFGATSRGQAYRYGAWKLWTATNQTEIVSFATSIDAAFLAPGDIIKLQDSDRFNNALSGRVKSMLNSTQLQLDRQVILTAGRTYELSLTLVDPTAETAENLSSDEVREIKVEHKTITPSVTAAVSTLTLPSAFSSTPAIGSVWVLKEQVDQATIDGSAKDYRILSITENGKNDYGITAVEHFNEKFDSVYGNFNLYQIENIFPDYTNSKEIYPTQNVYVSLNSDPAKKGDEFKILWDAPVGENSTLYTDVAGYEIYHNIKGYDSPLRVGGGINSYSFKGVDDGPYAVAVRSVNTKGIRSVFKTSNFDIKDKFRLNVPRKAEGVGIGGIVGAPLAVVNGVVKFIDGTLNVLAPGLATIVNPTDIITVDITTANLGLLPDNTYEILLDKSTSSLIPLLHKTVQNLGYWYTPGSEKSTIPGSATVGIKSNIVTASGASFKSSLKAGDVIFFTASEKYAKVTNVLTDNRLIIDRSFSESVTTSVQKVGHNIDFTQDSLICKVIKNEDTYTLSSYLSLDSTILPRQFKFVSAYKKEATTPTPTPTTGSYTSPIPTNWDASPPSLSQDGDIVWVITRTFTSDGQDQDADWSTPTIFSRREDGVSALSVVIESSTQGFTFRNNVVGTPKTLTARVYDMADGLEIVSDQITYLWTREGGVTVKVDNTTDNIVASDALVDATASFIVIDADDISNDSAELFSCEVVVP